jgi:hypothetical protein
MDNANAILEQLNEVNVEIKSQLDDLKKIVIGITYNGINIDALKLYMSKVYLEKQQNKFTTFTDTLIGVEGLTPADLTWALENKYLTVGVDKNSETYFDIGPSYPEFNELYANMHIEILQSNETIARIELLGQVIDEAIQKLS